MNLIPIFEELWRNNRIRSVLMIAVFIVNVCLVIALFTIMLPGLEKDQTTLRQQQSVQRKLGSEASRSSSTGAKPTLEEFYRRVAAYEQFPEFLQQLYQYSGDAGLKIDRITYRPENTDLRKVLRYQLIFSVTGKYQQIKEFIRALEVWPQLVVVEQVKLAGEKPDKDEVVLNIRLAAYFTTVSS